MQAQEKVRRFKCPGCAADQVFAPVHGALNCQYCGRVEQIPDSAEQVVERSYEQYLQLRPQQMSAMAAGALEVKCSSCSSIVTFTPPEVAGNCAFCDAKIVAQPKAADPLLAPEAVLPFHIDNKGAGDAIRKWLQSRWFAPNALKNIAGHDSIDGVYLPFWTYDSYTQSYYQGERGEHYYVTETYNETDAQGNTQTKTRQVQKTRWYSASGTVSRWFDDVLVPGTKSVTYKYLLALEPWDLASLKPYDPAYLSGFKAQRYQVELPEGFEIAKQFMADPIRSDVCRDIGGDEQRVHNISTAYSGVTFKHILLPIFIAAYQFNGKVYQVVVNARTSEVQGERPYSYVKIALLVGGILFAIFFIFLIILLIGAANTR